MAPIRILIVDDVRAWRHMVCTMLQERPEFHIIGEASDGLEAIQKSGELQPGVILLDIGLPKLNGLEAARRICALAPGSRILFVSENQCSAVAEEAMRTGPCARGYLVKSDAASDLLPALEAVAQDRRFVSARFAASIPGNFGDA